MSRETSALVAGCRNRREAAARERSHDSALVPSSDTDRAKNRRQTHRLLPFIGFYDGPIKVDFFYQEAEPHADPWLRDGFVALVDPDGLADALPARLADEHGCPDLSDFDAHAWDWLWWMDVKLSRGGQAWLVHIELAKFVETMLLTGHNALSPEPWRGASEVEQRLPAEVQAELRAALPAAPEPEELRRAFDVALQHYLRLRQQLATERRMPLAHDLARQVLDRIGPR